MKIYKNPIPYKDKCSCGDENKTRIYSLEIAGSLQFVGRYNPHFRNFAEVKKSNKREKRNIQEGICDIREGINDILEGLRDLGRGRRDIEDGIQDIDEGLLDFHGGQEKLAEGETDIREGLTMSKRD